MISNRTFATGFFQDEVIEGKVTELSGEPLVGATILIKGTSNGTVTDIDGYFRLQANPSDVIQVSFLGFTTEELLVGSQTYFNVTLKEDIATLEQVVVVGYGTVKKSDLTGAVSQIKAETITKTPVIDVNTALQGRVAGVNVATGSGAAGSESHINIRGIASTTGKTAPLYVVDGMPLELGGASIQDLGISNIESIEILKDASAAAIYGARAANGVVLITTKRGKEGTISFEGTAYYGFQEVINKIDMMSSLQYRDFLLDFNNGNAGLLPETIRNEEDVIYNTDWQDEVFRIAPMQNYTLSARGGSENATYSLDLGYLKQDDIFLTGNFNRFSIGSNLDFTYGRVKIGESVKLSFNTRENTGGSLWGPFSAPGYFPVRDPNNELGGWGTPGPNDGIDVNNPVGSKLRQDNQNQRARLLANTYMQIDLIEGLNFRINAGVDLSDGRGTSFEPPFDIGFNQEGITNVSESNSGNLTYNVDFLLNYRRKFNKSEITGLVGYNFLEQEKQRTVIRANTLPTGFDVWWAAENINPDVAASFEEEYALKSIFGRLVYSYDGKYIFTANLRRDESSTFSRQNNSGVFPSFSAAWNLHREKFTFGMEQLSELKVRVGYGQLGFDQIGNYRYSGTVSLNSNYVFGNEEIIGFAENRFGTPDIKWETSITQNIGVDLGLFDNRLLFTADLFKTRREDILVNKPIPFSNGSSDAPTVNAGKVDVKGLELTLSYQNETNWGLRYNISGNIASANNEVIELGEGQAIIASENILGSAATTITQEGGEIGAFQGLIMEGIWQIGDTTGMLTNYNTYGAQPGDVRYRDLNEDGSLTDEDRAIIGSPNPDFAYGFNFDLDYKNFDLSLFFQGVQGGEIYNIFGIVYSGMTFNYNQTVDNVNRWTEESPSNTIPSASGNSLNIAGSTRWIEDASYLRLKNVQIGYSLPQQIVSNIGLTKLRFYVSAQNPITWSKFSGYDPEIGSSRSAGQNQAQLTRNVLTGSYPQPKIYLAGVQIKF